MWRLRSRSTYIRGVALSRCPIAALPLRCGAAPTRCRQRPPLPTRCRSPECECNRLHSRSGDDITHVAHVNPKDSVRPRSERSLRADSAKSDIRRGRLASAQVIPKSECEIAWRPVAEGHDREDIRNRMDVGAKEWFRSGRWFGPEGGWGRGGGRGPPGDARRGAAGRGVTPRTVGASPGRPTAARPARRPRTSARAGGFAARTVPPRSR